MGYWVLRGESPWDVQIGSEDITRTVLQYVGANVWVSLSLEWWNPTDDHRFKLSRSL